MSLYFFLPDEPFVPDPAFGYLRLIFVLSAIKFHSYFLDLTVNIVLTEKLPLPEKAKPGFITVDYPAYGSGVG